MPGLGQNVAAVAEHVSPPAEPIPVFSRTDFECGEHQRGNVIVYGRTVEVDPESISAAALTTGYLGQPLARGTNDWVQQPAA